MLTPSSFQSWDTELEALAQAYAEKCIWDHNKERGRRGENLFAMAPTLDLEFAVEDWNGEEKYYNLTTSTCVPGQMCGHYTQVQSWWGKGMGLSRKELCQSPGSSQSLCKGMGNQAGITIIQGDLGMVPAMTGLFREDLFETSSAALFGYSAEPGASLS